MLSISATTALWFAPFVIPICLYVCWTDMARMKIPNHAVLALIGVFLVIGLIAVPLAEYPWRLLAGVVVLIVGFLLNAGGLLGAGDAKFAAAGAPFIAPLDYGIFFILLACVTLAAFVTHRGAMKAGLNNLVPNWESWAREAEFPFGLGLGGGLAVYMVLGLIYGA